MCDPTGLAVVRRAKAANTDRIDAKRMIRALAAWDRGETEALSRVRIPTVEEEDAKRLMRRRERLVRDRTRIGNTILGLLNLQRVTDRRRPETEPDKSGDARCALLEATFRPESLCRSTKLSGKEAAEHRRSEDAT